MLASNVIRLDLEKDIFKARVELSFREGECLGLWGPSGSGKTTILRAIAGFETPKAAYINVAGEVWQDNAKHISLPTYQRSLGFVFQEASLFPHLNVQKNLEYALHRNKSALSPLELNNITELLDIKGLMSKYSGQLSGGERQRVAIARALLSSPKLLLLDEPLSAIDVHKKEEVLPWLERVRRDLGISMVYVTHSLEELTRLADRVAVLRGGEIVTQGSLLEVIASHKSHFYFDNQDPGVLVEGVIGVVDSKWNLVELVFTGGTLWLKDQNFRPGQALRVKISASDVSIATQLPQQTSIQNILPGVIDNITQLKHPGECLVIVNCQGTSFQSKITLRAVEQLELTPGRPVWLQVKSVALLK